MSVLKMSIDLTCSNYMSFQTSKYLKKKKKRIDNGIFLNDNMV